MPVLHLSYFFFQGMSTADVGPPPSGPNLQDPISGCQELITDPGPDGRNIGDNITSKKTVQEQPAETETSPAHGDETTEQIKANVTFEENIQNSEAMDTSGQKTTETPLPTKTELTEKDSAIDNETRDHVIDIVKQSKLEDSSKNISLDFGDLPDLAQSRPLTETTNRDGTRMSYDTEKERKEVRSEPDRDTKTPFSVRVERKPLHTAQTRSHSDYYSKTPSTSRYTYIAASLSQFSGFHHDFRGLRNQRHHQLIRNRRPPKLVRLATVTMSPK